MAGDKKKGGKKGGDKKGKDDEEDVSVDQFFKHYKKNCTSLGVTASPIIKEKYEEYQEEGEFIKKFHLWDELGWAGIRAIMDALRHVKYQHCTSIRLWKTFCEDEGVRAVCQYAEMAPNLSCLELLDNKMTPLGCEFVSRV